MMMMMMKEIMMVMKMMMVPGVFQISVFLYLKKSIPISNKNAYKSLYLQMF